MLWKGYIIIGYNNRNGRNNNNYKFSKSINMRKLLLLFAVMMAVPSFAQLFDDGILEYEVLDNEAKTCKVTGAVGGVMTP